MALNKSIYKIGSSIATFLFANRDLLEMTKIIKWQQLSMIPAPLVRSQKEYEQLIGGVRLTTLIYHTEVLKQGFFEHCELFEEIPHSQYLESIKWFLNDLRNAFAHAKGELLPRFSKNDKIKGTKDPKTIGTFKINIPVTKLANGYEQFDPKSKIFKTFQMKVAPGKLIKVNDKFINDLYDLSMHVLEIAKKQNLNTLSKYLNRIPPV